MLASIVLDIEFIAVTMEAASPSDQREFYGDVLGLPVAEGTADEVAVQAGRTRVAFRRARSGTTPTYHFALRVPGERFRAAKSWLAQRTRLLEDDGRDEFDWSFWAARAVYAKDPAGNVLELIGFTDGSPAEDAEFDAGSILGLAELGLPVSDVGAAAAALRDTFGIGLWDRDEVTPEGITPVGERGATFLLVRIGRVWHLGGAAGDHPLEIELAGVGGRSLELRGHPYSVRGMTESASGGKRCPAPRRD